MYLPLELPNAQMLIAVKTYPLPSNKYNELVCTAGFLPDGKWVRLYPVPFRALDYEHRYEKYHWINLDLVRNTKDFRPESYRLKQGFDTIRVGEKIDTKDKWSERKMYALGEVFTSMHTLIELAYSNEKRSLGTFKPREIIEFVIEEEEEREWKPKWRDQLLQYSLFDLNEGGEGKKRQVIPKLPYKYSYKFVSEGDRNPRKLMIEDWELGMLYWNCLRQCEGDEKEANRLVRKKYFDEFCTKKEIYLFVGTSMQFHRRRSRNPFMIIGVFYPPLPTQKSSKEIVPPDIDMDAIRQRPLFEL